MQDVEYGRVNMTIRVHENDLLNKSHYDRMLDAPSYEDALRVLLDTKYRDDVDEAIESREYETMLGKELRRAYGMIQEQVPDERLSELLTMEYAYHNLKVLFKETITDQDFSGTLIDVSRYPIYEFRKAVATQESTVLPELYLNSIRNLHQLFSESPGITGIDVYVDSEYSEHLIKLAQEMDEPDVLEYAKLKIDLENLSTFFRAKSLGFSANHIQAVLSDFGSVPKRYFVDLASDNLSGILGALKESDFRTIINASYDDHNEFSLSRLERQIDKAEIEYLSKARMKVFGPLPVLSYINAIETEVKNLRLILTGKLNSVDSEIVRERMRLNYAV